MDDYDLRWAYIQSEHLRSQRHSVSRVEAMRVAIAWDMSCNQALVEPEMEWKIRVGENIMIRKLGLGEIFSKKVKHELVEIRLTSTCHHVSAVFGSS